MPRFLDTGTGEFVWIEDPSTIGYAILSHTWRSKQEGGEQSYTQVEKLRKHIRKARTFIWFNALSILSHPDLSDKIKGICKVARKAGYQYVWIDSCCIDKTSSAELAEAINSMFDLYRLATVCYVYLSDVSDGTRARKKGSSFAKSRWHTRGWTLQELIAPDRVVFLTSGWAPLGTKISLAVTLRRITGIDIALLTGRASLESFSVARRMSWAANRQTTRVEDEAYSLLGIFGVHMSPIYGEGRNAFLRLQEEIIKNIPDQSIFAWGSSIAFESSNGTLRPEWYKDHESSMSPTGLLAPFPGAFSDTGDVEPLSPEDFALCLSGEAKPAGDGQGPVFAVPSLHCVFTPQGVRLDVLCIDLAEMIQISDLAIGYSKYGVVRSKGDNTNRRWLEETQVSHCLQRGRARSLAVLRCRDGLGRLLALPLFSTTSSSGEQRGKLVTTHIRCSDSCPGNPPYRFIRLAPSALAVIRGRHLLPRQPAEVFFLRNSGMDNNSKPDKFLVIDLWDAEFVRAALTASHGAASSGRDSSPSAMLQLAPTCKEELRLLGFEVIPPTVALSPSWKEVFVETVLASPLLAGQRRQHIQIKLVVGLPLPRDSTFKLQFSVTNSLHVSELGPVNREGDGRKGFPTNPSKLAAPDTQCTFCQLPGCMIREARSDSTWTTFASKRVTKTSRTIARAQFVIYAGVADPQWVQDRDRAVMRDLRLALECPWDAFNGTSVRIRKLWLSVELSEVYRGSPSDTYPCQLISPSPLPI